MAVHIPYHAGSFNIRVNLSYSVGGNLSLNPGYCKPVAWSAYCFTTVYAGVYILGGVTDLTTHRQVSVGAHGSGRGTYIANGTDCRFGPCTYLAHGKSGGFSSSRSVSWLIMLSGKMIRTDRYALVLNIHGWAAVSLYTSTPKPYWAVGSAYLDFGPTGFGLALASISET